MFESAFHGDIDSVISSNNCSRFEFAGPIGFSVPAPGIGPSDFPREGWLAFKCKDSKLALTLTAQSVGNPMGDIDLKCRVVEESIPRQ